MLFRSGRAIVEAPTYDRMLQTLAAAGADVVTIENGEDGLDVDALRGLAASDPKPKLLYVLPTFQNPTGRTLTFVQRQELVAIALEHDLPVFEDDPYGLLRVEGEPQPYVHTLLREAGGDHLAIFASSFSKSVAPGLRVGYVILPEPLVAPVEALATRAYVSPPLLPQAQLLDFLLAGELDPHLAFLAGFLRARRDALLDVLDAELTGVARWTRPAGGYFLWIDFPADLDAAELNERSTAAGVTFVPGRGFFHGNRGHGTARLSYSYPGVEDIRTGATRLAALVRDSAPATTAGSAKGRT